MTQKLWSPYQKKSIKEVQRWTFSDDRSTGNILIQIGNVGRVPEKLKLAVVISPKQESQGYEEDHQIQGNKNKTIQNDEREKNTVFSGKQVC